MTSMPVTGTLGITGEEVREFAEASGDTSPLHVDESYARRTPFGEPVAHGVLCVLKALAAGPELAGLRLSGLKARFPGPVVPGQQYTWTAEETGPDPAPGGTPFPGERTTARLLTVRILDGRRVLVEARVTLEPGEPRPAPARSAAPVRTEKAAAGPLAGLARGQVIGTSYRPDWAALTRLREALCPDGHAVDTEQLAVLAWASQLAGMEAPGRAALISGLELECEAATERADFTARGEIADVDERYRTLRLEGEAAAGLLRARVRVRVFARREGGVPSVGRLRELLDGHTRDLPLGGRTAFVTGGSRGFGAAVSAALALAGCTVHLAFRDSRAEADGLVAALGPDGSRLRLHQGDAADPQWCARTRRLIVETDGPTGLLVLNAGPAARALDLHPAAVRRAGAHVEAAVRLAQAPLAAFAEDLAACGGQVVAVSSAYAAAPPRGMSHYSAAKHAVEGLVRASVSEFPQISGLVVRPPRLATTFADGVTGSEEPLAVEPVAAAVVRRIIAGGEAGRTAVLDDFGPRHAPPDPAVPEARPEAPATELPSGGTGTLAVAGTFTTDHLSKGLTHWAGRLGLDLSVRLLPYGQVFQALLDPAGVFAGNTRGCNAVLLRFEDWPRGAEARRTADEFAAAARDAAQRSTVPLLVVLCPPSPPAAGQLAAEFEALEERLRSAVAGVRGLHLTGTRDWCGPYPVERHHDAAREEHAHIPYTPVAHTVLATTVARKVHSLLAPPFKVLVLDCDNTLWRGVCGEAGADGIEIGAAHRRLQEWAVQRHDEGVLVCLSSKNSEEDVDEVFRRHPGMPLRSGHIAARRVDWNPKPGNIEALARELGVGLDSVVFLDDNPVEVAAVRAACPQVLALTLPREESRWPGFLDRLWAFDKPEVTQEDRRRTDMYRAGRERAALRETTATLGQFIEGLDLRVDVREADSGRLARIAQLTQRTNQFNLRPERRTESQLRALLEGGARCWVAEVRDRFGDYGLVGVAVVSGAGDAEPGTAVLDTFLLSCRVLGRGVEHAFLAAVAARLAGNEGCRTLRAVHRPTRKNIPVRTFLDSVLGHSAPAADDSGDVVYLAPLEETARITFRPDATDDSPPATASSLSAPPPRPVGGAARLAALADLACELTDAPSLHRAVTGEAAEAAGHGEAGHRAAARTGEALDRLREVLAGLVRLPPGELRSDTTLESLRLESLEIVDATVALEEHFGRLPRTLFFEHRTLGEVAGALERTQGRAAEPAVPFRADAPARSGGSGVAADEGIAVVGIAGRFPGAADTGELWKNLLSGTESLGDAMDRWGRPDLLDPAGGPNRTYTSAGGLIEGVDEFDALFFGLAPSEAGTMDPQQRLFLQTAYHALEDAGHTAADLGRNVGVYVASMGPDYAVLSADAALDGRSRYPNSDIYQIANRVSYFLDLTGPSIAVDTACSGSGVALQLACDAIRAGTVSAAVAGGVNVILHPARRIQYAQQGMLSATGRCRPFGAGADGMVTSEGVGAVLLRPLRDALEDGDHVYGVIKAVVTNSGGRTSGFTVPSPAAQAELVRTALRRAGAGPAAIGYVEAHGTGTPLGDPIEMRALAEAFGTLPRDVTVPVGSIKGNIGHTEAAAAMAGLTKVLLQLRHRTLVPSLHAEQLNPEIPFEETPFRVQRTTAPWPAGPPGAPRRASLSSFGAGGVNVHMVVEEAPPEAPEHDRAGTGPELVLLSARDDERLRAACLRLAAWLRGAGTGVPLADIAFTLRSGRERFASRLAVPARDHQHLLTVLDRLSEPGRDMAGSARDRGDAAFDRADGRRDLRDVFDGGREATQLLRSMAERGDLLTLGRLWCAGADIDWASVLPGATRRRVPLPGYPFARARHWLPGVRTPGAPTPPGPSGRSSEALTYYAPRWAAGPAPGRPPAVPADVVVVGDAGPWGAGADHRVPDLSRLPRGTAPGRGLVVVDRRGLDSPHLPVPEAAARAAAAVVASARLAAGGRDVVHVCLGPADETDPHAAVVPGFGRALAQEIPRFRAVRIEVAAGTPEPALAEVVAEAGGRTSEIRLNGGERQVRRWEPLAVPGERETAFRRGGHYLITGGRGGIGTTLAAFLTERYGASVTLTGRSAVGGEAEAARERARACGGDLLHLCADATDPGAVASCIAVACERFGPLNGVIHAAGHLHDGRLEDVTDEDIRGVLAPKITGTVLLDAATASCDLDFFLVMSSFVGTFGNAGQASYCAANRFLDAFARRRAALVARGLRRGRSVSALWPLWEEGGMTMPPAVRRLTETTVGLTAIPSAAAWDAVRDVIALGHPTVLVGSGAQDRIAAALAALEPAAQAPGSGRPGTDRAAEEEPAQAGRATLTAARLGERLRAEAAGLVGIPADAVRTDAEFGDYGFNSMLFTDFANRINDLFGLALTPVVFFEHPTLDALGPALYERHRERLEAAVPPVAEVVSDPVPPTAEPLSAGPPPSGEPEGPAAVPGPHSGADRTPSPPEDRRAMPVAVIGMAARLPGAPDLDTYWENLLARRDLVAPAPPGRFPGEPPRGGFLEDVLAFDADFFGISPREARLMDPQQRLFLEAGWHALEDAGHDPRALGGSRTGVFAGATLSDYAGLLSRTGEEVAGHSVTGHVQSVIANRLSHLLDLRGPSEVLDTACSSSLTAVHRAVRALEAGECEMAVAGGVNALFDPTWFESLGKAGMLSGTGRCWTFDERADGFIRGEGVGAVVLKPLGRAMRDGDTIHGVITGSAVNHGGRAHSLTAPNPEAQADVIVAALRSAGADPRTVSLVETHGTGTRLGDPIEVAGLTSAFRRLGAGDGGPWCHLGAVKTNIGHLESAAGMAGLLKVLLALRHRTLPPNAAGERANPHLRLANGPFQVPREAREWLPTDAAGRPVPLRAGVSAFGFGGANAHVVVEEPPARSEAGTAETGAPSAHLVVLSATGRDRLRAYARRLRAHVTGTGTGQRLADLAHTSRVARPALPVRLAVVAADLPQLRARLDSFLSGQDAPGLHTADPPGPDAAGHPADDGTLRELARRWVGGGPVAWPAGEGRRRVPFPTYPFDHSTAHGPTAVPVPSPQPAPGGRAEPGPVPPAPPPAAEDDHSHAPQLLARSWRPAETPGASPAGLSTCLLVVGREADVSLMEELAGLDDVRWLVLREPSALPALAATEFEVPFDDYEGGRRVAGAIVAEHGPPDAVIDLVDAMGAGGPDREAARTGLLQVLAAGRHSGGLRLVHVGRGVEAGGSGPLPSPAGVLTGARMAALVRALGAEYSALRTVTVETGTTDGRQPEPSPLALAMRELGTAGEEPAVRYENGVRHVARLTDLTLPAPAADGHLGAFPVDPHRPYLITGGTGGLGLAAAGLLVARGARRLVLAGRRALPDRERWAQARPDDWWAGPAEAIVRLEAAGAQVMLADGPLTGEAGTPGWPAAMRARFGPPAGVLHCAGSLSATPAFVHKTYEEITACWEPKGSGLLALDRALADEEPDFVALYSSVSAVVPALATGLSDYAGANAALDAFAAYATERGRLRGSRTRWIAIDWGSWADIGMGEVTSPRYRGLGLSAMTREQGLGLLDAALSTKGHTSLVALTAKPGAAGALLPEGGAPPAGEPVTGRDAGRTMTERTERCAAHITGILAAELLLDRERIAPDTRFGDLGVDSILIAAIVTKLEALAGAPLEPSVILEHPTVRRLAHHLADSYPDGLARWAASPAAERGPGDRRPRAVPAAEPLPDPGAPRPAPDTLPLAVIGMAGRFPGAPTTAGFWELLRNGRSGIREVPRARWDVASLYSPEYRSGRSISKWGGFLDGIEEFDAEYFGVPEADAAHMDPLTRLFLETAEQTFADAGYRGEELEGRRIGVFVGSGTSTYGARVAVPGRATATGLNQNFIGAQLAHFRDLRGPNLVVDTACSSSLTSLFLAHQALQLGECEMAVVGGADLILDETPYLSLSAARALSPDGVCRVFDAGANGFVPGEGVGAVLVKPLRAALSDGDRVLAVIEATAVNNDGRTMGLTTPNPEAQRAVVQDALRKAGAEAGSVSYVETHGTGTMIGDPIELRALTEVFGEHTADRGFCGVGSVKSNVGHLLMAAGMAGLHKVVLSLMHQALPPTLHCAHPNPRFAFDTSPFRLQTELEPWRPRHGVRRAGLSAFGFGGTNCHVVLRGLRDGERDPHPVRRSPLPAPVFHRRRHWAGDPGPTGPAQPPQSPRPLLELEEVVQP